MAFSIKTEISLQLRRIGLHFEKPMLRVLPPRSVLCTERNGIGQTFYVDLPKETYSMITAVDKINSNLIKNIKNNLRLFEHVEIRTNDETENNQILMKINFDFVVKELFKNLRQNLTLLFSYYRKLDKSDIEHDRAKKKIIVEYSSPNIAKPFHVGNLRSTILGNSIANILQFGGHEVLRMNYLGDWGTQFGILSLAYDQYGAEDKLKSEPLKHLFDVYVKGNQECQADEKWRDLAKERFYQLELKKNSEVYEQWIRFRGLSLIELDHLYQRLGIKFDILTSESMYSGCGPDIINILKSMKLIETIDGTVYSNIRHYNDPMKIIQVPLVKKDGTSLYLTRDIAAVLHRKKHYSFDRMYYVVDSSQSKHFNNLKSIFYSLEDPIYQDIKHLKFGRILGMSTRKGDIIFLDDVLNEAKNRALDAIKFSPNTKIDPDLYDQVADILGVSSIIVQDLAHYRVTEYKFNWNSALKMNGNTGISIQYAHARVSNLIRNCQYELNPEQEINVSAIDTKEGRTLVNVLLMFDEIIDAAYEELEPSILTNYIFQLKTAINCAHQELTIKGQEESIVQTRLLLFICAKNVLNQCMQLIGLRPLESM